MSMHHAMNRWLLLSAMVLPLASRNGRAAELIGLLGSAGSARVELRHVPATEQLAALRLGLRVKPGIDLSAVAASSPDNGAWSQIRPELTRSGNVVTIASVSPAIMRSMDTSHVLIMTVDLSFGDTALRPVMISDFVDSVWVDNALTPDGANAGAIPLSQISLAARSATVAGATGNVAFRTIGRAYVFRFNLKEPVKVRARVLDAGGRTLRVLRNSRVPAGAQSVSWDGRDARGVFAPKGVYFVQLEVGTFTYSKKISFVK